jgi:hypothetical protein
MSEIKPHGYTGNYKGIISRNEQENVKFLQNYGEGTEAIHVLCFSS